MKKKLIRWFTSMVLYISSVRSKLLKKLGLRTSLQYTLHGIDTLLLSAYIDCSENKNFKKLLKSGSAPDHILISHFLTISIEYNDLIASDTNKEYAGLLKQRVRLNGRKNLTVMLFKFYMNRQSPEIKALLSRNGFFFDVNDPLELVVKKFTGFIKNLDINIANTEKDIATFENDNKSDEPATRETYIRNIIEMSKHGYSVDFNNATLEFYAIAFKAFNSYIKLKLENSNA